MKKMYISRISLVKSIFFTPQRMQYTIFCVKPKIRNKILFSLLSSLIFMIYYTQRKLIRSYLSLLGVIVLLFSSIIDCFFILYAYAWQFYFHCIFCIFMTFYISKLLNKQVCDRQIFELLLPLQTIRVRIGTCFFNIFFFLFQLVSVHRNQYFFLSSIFSLHLSFVLNILLMREREKKAKVEASISMRLKTHKLS